MICHLNFIFKINIINKLAIITSIFDYCKINICISKISDYMNIEESIKNDLLLSKYFR